MWHRKPCMKTIWLVKEDLEEFVYWHESHSFPFVTRSHTSFDKKTYVKVWEDVQILVDILPFLNIHFFLSSHPIHLWSRADILQSSRRHCPRRGAPAVHEEWRLSPWNYGAGYPRLVLLTPPPSLPSLGRWDAASPWGRCTWHVSVFLALQRQFSQTLSLVTGSFLGLMPGWCYCEAQVSRGLP